MITKASEKIGGVPYVRTDALEALTPVIDDEQIEALGIKYHIELDPNHATQYKLCQVILMLEAQIEKSPTAVKS